jgi:hypothetical protein
VRVVVLPNVGLEVSGQRAPTCAMPDPHRSQVRPVVLIEAERAVMYWNRSWSI